MLTCQADPITPIMFSKDTYLQIYLIIARLLKGLAYRRVADDS